ncbi:hypothetical protein [Acidovorax sp.]|uniref:hypothetical protein n=1 Tax=Acidovorax sp. TaxID=1872122 RepID=UPI00391F4A43
MKRLFVTLLSACAGISFAQPECYPVNNRPGIISNVSSTGIATRGNPVTVCTVINSLESLDSSTLFMAESTTGDTMLEIFYPFERSSIPNMQGEPYNQNLFPRRTFDNYRETLNSSELALLKSKLRLPDRETDAAAMMTSDERFYSLIFVATFWTQGKYNYKFGVCASGYPKEGSATTAVSITNLGPTKNGTCYQRSGYYFEK